ncbi:MAG: MarR family transcriptional regulator [Nitrososphaerota archaeon]|nr:MarR family transcriptional regulator [Nitrososphaerota archaeon]
MLREPIQESSDIVSERIADSVWEIWIASKNASSPIKTGEVTHEQYWILRLLYMEGPQRVKDIASHIGTTPSPVTISMKRLEHQDLVKRVRSTKDERVVTVELTKHGRKRFEAWRDVRRKSLSRLFDTLKDREKQMLLGLMSKVTDSLSTSIKEQRK